MNSSAAIPLSVLLKKCNHGTSLHVSHTTEATSYLLPTAESEKNYLICDFMDSYALFQITLQVDFIKIGAQSNT